MASWLEKVFENAKQGHTKYDVYLAQDLEKQMEALTRYLQEHNFSAQVTYPKPGERARLEVSHEDCSCAFDVHIKSTRNIKISHGEISICAEGHQFGGPRESYEYSRNDTPGEDDYKAQYGMKLFSTFIARTMVAESQSKKHEMFKGRSM